MRTIRGRILVLFSAFALTAVGFIYLTSRGVRSVNRVLDSVVTEHMTVARALDKMESSLLRKVSAMNRYLVSGDKTWLEINNAEREYFLRGLKQARSLSRSEGEWVIYDEIADLYGKYLERNRVLLERLGGRRGVFAAQESLIRMGDDYVARIQNRINEIAGVHEGIIQAQVAQARQRARAYERLTALFLVVGALFGLFLEFYLVRRLLRPLTQLVEGLRNFARGHVAVQMPPSVKDEMGELQDAFNEMTREIAEERVRLASQSSTDSMTGLSNLRRFRGQLLEECYRARRYGRPLSLLMLDVDHFKTYNDKNGHPAGDELLKEIARTLQRLVRGTDLVGRYGGEEFVILLLETGLGSARAVAEKIRKTIEETPFPFREAMPGGRVSVSIGVASIPENGPLDDKELITVADRALYAAKAAGRNRISLAPAAGVSAGAAHGSKS